MEFLTFRGCRFLKLSPEKENTKKVPKIEPRSNNIQTFLVYIYLFLSLSCRTVKAPNVKQTNKGQAATGSIGRTDPKINVVACCHHNNKSINQETFS
jgi:hypothetical protein